MAWLTAAGLLASSCLCIAEGTLVDTPAGLVPIEQLRVGALVWSVDITTGQRVTATLVGLRSAERECMALSFDATTELVCTPDHPLYAPDLGTYVEASRFIAGEAGEALRVTSEGANAIGVRSHQRYVGVRRVFDLTVDSQHHNFIANGIVVHNKSIDECARDPQLYHCDSSPINFDSSSTGDDSSPTNTTTSESSSGTDTADTGSSESGSTSSGSTGSGSTGSGSSDTSASSDSGTSGSR